LRRGDKVYVRDPSVKGGGYWRKLPEGVKAGGSKLEDRSIRELQSIASRKQIYRANHLTKDQLIRQIKLVESNPEEERNFRKTLERRRKERTAVLSSLPKGAAKDLRLAIKLQKIVSANPKRAGILLAAGIIGFTAAKYEQAKSRHRDGFKESADIALTRAKQMQVDTTSKENILFAVGGGGSQNSKGDRLREMLLQNTDNSEEENWFGERNHVVAFKNPDEDSDLSPHNAKWLNGKPNPFHLAHQINNRIKGYITNNIVRGRSDAAIDLAAQLYAYGNRYPDKPLNIVAHGVGGNISNEAIEILGRMKKADRSASGGLSITERINLVRLGSPTFGVADTPSIWRNVNDRTVTSAKDPASWMPKRKPQWIASVMGGEAEDYLKNRDVRDKLREGLNYYSSRISNRSNALQKQLDEATERYNPSLNTFLDRVGQLKEMALGDKASYRLFAGSTVTGLSPKEYAAANKKYQENVKNAADLALAEAAKLNKPKLDAIKKEKQNNLTFLMGGTWEKDEDLLDGIPEGDRLKGRTSKSGNLAGGMTKFFSVASEFGIKEADAPFGASAFSKDERFKHISIDGFGAAIRRNLGLSAVDTEPVDPESIRLAANLFALSDNIESRPNRRIAMLASKDAGIKARVSYDILYQSLVKTHGVPKAQKIMEQFRLATISTPTFGMAEAGTPLAELSLIGANDRFGVFPQKTGAHEIDGVGDATRSYMANADVLNYLRKLYR
jgi:hypothetical protein